jgi:hypothetical protein
MKISNRNSIFIGISLVLFVLLAIFYANPVLTGKELIQHDIVQYQWWCTGNAGISCQRWQ